MLLLFFASALFSCKKTELQTTPVYSEASYKMTVTMNWTSPQFSVPTGAHVTTLIGMIHSKDTLLWKEGKLATEGLEDVAEVGNITKMNLEIDAIIAKNKALSKFQIAAPLITGTAETNLLFNTTYPTISFASMIAPSPDWFMGVSNISLFVNNKWLDELNLYVRVYDAGTEDGDIFGYNNPSTSPQQPAMLLTATNASVLANTNATIAPIATIRFVRN